MVFQSIGIMFAAIYSEWKERLLINGIGTLLKQILILNNEPGLVVQITFREFKSVKNGRRRRQKIPSIRKTCSFSILARSL